ncbi:MAG: type II secretion system protein [Elusimicrobia bacterium]|nr:type II secretion system protein [Elusimicrobiota bacterium]
MYKNVVMLKPCGSPFQQPYQREKRLNKQPRFRGWRRAAGRNDAGEKGFTLIELLVVVLIIGILSAVALPQYQKAVDKSRMAEIFLIAKGVETAEQSYYMANGNYTDNLDDLDIQFTIKSNMRVRIFPEDGKNVSGWMVQVYNATIDLTFQRYFSLPFDQCVAYSSRADQLCKSLGGVFAAETSGHRIYRINK